MSENRVDFSFVGTRNSGRQRFDGNVIEVQITSAFQVQYLIILNDNCNEFRCVYSRIAS